MRRSNLFWLVPVVLCTIGGANVTEYPHAFARDSAVEVQKSTAEPKNTESEEQDLANIEALSNIIGNCTEIVLFGAGMSTMIAGIALLFVPDRKKLGPVLIIGGIVATLIGIAAPGLCNLFIDSLRQSL